MNLNLLRRRETLLKLMTRGVSLQVAAEEMTKELTDPYERQKQINTIRRDWANRKHWLDNIVRLSDSTVLAEIIAGLNEVVARAWVEYFRSDDSAARIGALRTITTTKTRTALILMRAGVIQEAPQKIDSTMTIAGTPFDVDPELKQALLEETERQRIEKERQNVKPPA